DKYWNDVTEWELKDKTTFDTTLAWRPWDPLTIYGGYKNVQTDRDKTKDPLAPYDRKTESIVTAGLDYGIRLSRLTRVTVGYEWQDADVTLRGASYTDKREPRHTIKLALDQEVGEGGLRIEAKRIAGAGGDGADKNDAVDYVASATVSLPMVRNLSFNLGARYVDSRGNKRDAGE